MTTNIDRAVEIIGQHVKCGWTICERRRRSEDGKLPPLDACGNTNPSCRDVAEGVAQDLADAGRLAPDLSAVTRITVAGGGKRQMEEWNLHDVELHIQDEGRTLKIFYRTNIREKRSRTAADHAEGVGRADA